MDIIDSLVEELKGSATDEEVDDIVSRYAKMLSTEDVILAIADLSISLDASEELTVKLASVFTTALVDTMVETGLVTDVEAFSNVYLEKLDNNWDLEIKEYTGGKEEQE